MFFVESNSFYFRRGEDNIVLFLNMVQGDAVIGKIAFVYLQMLISVIGIDMNL